MRHNSLSKIGRNGAAAAGAALVLLVSTPCLADTTITAAPTGWRLQTYAGSAVAAYYTSSTCPSGALNFSSSATIDDKNRFWSLIMAAKATGQSVGVTYDSSGSCQITSFWDQ